MFHERLLVQVRLSVDPSVFLNVLLYNQCKVTEFRFPEDVLTLFFKATHIF